MGKVIKAKNFTLQIESTDGQFVLICQERAAPPQILAGDFEITGEVRMDWPNRWKLQAYLTPPM
jgi:hypothetical protein